MLGAEHLQPRLKKCPKRLKISLKREAYYQVWVDHLQPRRTYQFKKSELLRIVMFTQQTKRNLAKKKAYIVIYLRYILA